MSAMPLVQIDTAGDNPPLVIEAPDVFPFQPGERELYREATDTEYGRYVDWWNTYYEEHP